MFVVLNFDGLSIKLLQYLPSAFFFYGVFISLKIPEVFNDTKACFTVPPTEHKLVYFESCTFMKLATHPKPIKMLLI